MKRVHDQFAQGIDLIGIGRLQAFATCLMIGCLQDTPKKRELTPNTPRHDETILGFLDRFPLYLTSTSSSGGGFQPFFDTVTSRGSHTS